jgi:hypothetical protein
MLMPLNKEKMIIFLSLLDFYAINMFIEYNSNKAVY